MPRTLTRALALSLILLCVCPFTAPFPTFDLHGSVIDEAKLTIDDVGLPVVYAISWRPAGQPITSSFVLQSQAHAGPAPALILRI
jgi:hypothetical protein